MLSAAVPDGVADAARSFRGGEGALSGAGRTRGRAAAAEYAFAGGAGVAAIAPNFSRSPSDRSTKPATLRILRALPKRTQKLIGLAPCAARIADFHLFVCADRRGARITGRLSGDSALPQSARNNTMTTWGETNHDGEADRIYRERLFDPTLEAPFLDTTDTHLGRAQLCLAWRGGGAAIPATNERCVLSTAGRARSPTARRCPSRCGRNDVPRCVAE